MCLSTVSFAPRYSDLLAEIAIGLFLYPCRPPSLYFSNSLMFTKVSVTQQSWRVAATRWGSLAEPIEHRWSRMWVTQRSACSWPKSLQTRSQAVARITDRTAKYTRYFVLPHSTFGGHVTSKVTWPSLSPHGIFYSWSFGTESLSPAVFKRIGVMSLCSLTFQGHVASSVTWSCDSS